MASPIDGTTVRDAEQIRDEILVLRCQDHDEAAFTELVERWNGRLYAHALQIVGRPDVARDAVQEAWFAIIRDLGRLHDPASFGGYAHRILSRRAADQLRGDQRRARLARAVGENPATPTGSDAERESDSSRVRDALSRLPSDRRDILALRYLHEMTVAEIASRLRVPQGTIKSRLHEARKRLRGALTRASATTKTTPPENPQRRRPCPS